MDKADPGRWRRAKSLGATGLTILIPAVLLSAAYHWGRDAGYRDGAADMRDAIMCVLERTSGELPQKYCAAMSPPTPNHSKGGGDG